MVPETHEHSDVLTIAVLLPESEAAREQLFEHIASNGEIHGCIALNAMQGNMLNYVRANMGLESHQEASAIYKRLSAESEYQIGNATQLRALMAVSVPAGLSETQAQGPSAWTQTKFAALMFVFGYLVCMNFG